MKKFSILALIFLFINISCSSTQPQEEDIQALYHKAMKFLDKKRYLRAQEEFGNVAIKGLHTELGDDAQYYLAESYFLNKEYILAIAEYDQLIRRMGFSEYTQKARWRICQCYVKQSPKYFLEQSSTENALSKIQEYIDDYPNSEYHEEALDNIKVLRSKLAQKIFESGRLYIKMEEFDSAIITYEDLLANYYDTNLVEETHFQIIRCHLLTGDVKQAAEYLATNRNKIVDKELLAKAERMVINGDLN